MYRLLSQKSRNIAMSVKSEAFLAYVRYVAAGVLVVLGAFLVFPLLVSGDRVFSIVSDGLVSFGLPVNKVVIRGNFMANHSAVYDVVDEGQSIVLLPLRELRQQIRKQSPWIKDVKINRVLSSGILNVDIEEHDAFANWCHHGINSVIDRTGYVITNSEGRLEHLVSVYGDDAVDHLGFVRDVLGDSGPLSTMISSFSLLDAGGWNVDFSSGLRVKLPGSNPQEAWRRLMQLYLDSDGLLMWSEIDMRNADRISVKK